MSCETPATLNAFAAGTLGGAEAERVAAHVEGCAACAAGVEAAAGDWRAVRAQYTPRVASERLRSTIRWTTREPAARGVSRLAVAGIAALAAVLLVALGVTVSRSRAPAGETLEQLAVQAHDAYLSGAAPLDLRMGDHRELAAEISRRLAFALQLPPMAGAGLTLLGARVAQLGDRRAAMLVYQQGADVLSLTVVPRGSVPLGRGVVQQFRGVDFHFSELGGRHIVQWSEGDSSYALVSSAVHTTASCGICHAPGSGLSSVEGFHRPE